MSWYDYNPAGQLISETQSHLGSGAITYDYYGSGDTGAGQRPLAPRQTTFATSGTPAVQTGYQYDSAGRLWKVTSGTLEVEYGYKAGTTLVNAVTTRQGGTIVATETRTYENTTDRLKKIERKNAAGDVVYSIDYTSFSDRDQRESANVVRRQTNNAVENQTWNWNYDPYGQLIGYTETTNEWETAYDFDEAGNRDGRSANNVNQYANRSYDGNGNQTSDGTWAYVYNALDQMVGATRLDGSERVSYAYDGQGRRVFKDTFISTDAGLNWVLSSSRKFGYDGTQLIAEYDNTTGALLRSFTWGIGIGQVGALLSISVYGANGTVAARYFPFFDGTGNVTGLTDAAGAVVATYEYSPFGNLLSSNGTTEALAANPFGFSTMYFDGETGKYHYPYREYDPVDGRWMTRDPIAESGGVNLYAFVENDAVNKVDPNGKQAVDLAAHQRGFARQMGEYDQWRRERPLSNFELLAPVTAGAMGSPVNRAYQQWHTDVSGPFTLKMMVTLQTGLAVLTNVHGAAIALSEGGLVGATGLTLSAGAISMNADNLGGILMDRDPYSTQFVTYATGSRDLGLIANAGLSASFNAGSDSFVFAPISLGSIFNRRNHSFASPIGRASVSHSEWSPGWIVTGARQLPRLAINEAAVALKYEWIRSLPAELNVQTVARNTDLPEWYIRAIRNHIFFDSHEIPDIADAPRTIRRLTPDDEIARWWEAATTGKIPQNEMEKIHLLFAHEYVEHSLERYGMPHRFWIDADGYRPFDLRGAHDLSPLIPELRPGIPVESGFDNWARHRLPPFQEGVR